jgi:hypothetical protein
MDWESMASAPSGWGNFFLVRPAYPNPITGGKCCPTVVQQAGGRLYSATDELDCLLFGETELEPNPLLADLEWHPIP